VTDYTRIRTPFAGFSFCPDVPSNALAPNEYNNGLNVEADVRGIKKVAGEAEILSTIPGNVFFIEAGFRSETNFVYIAATTEGKWYLITTAGVSNITPGVGANPSVALSGYNNDLNITTSVVGSVFFINDTLNNPMYFTSTASEIAFTADAQWNYDIGVTKTTAAFVRNYCSPNVGNILVSGNITKVASGITTNYPTTVRWSQAFAQTGIPGSWMPTLSNVANEQEVPVRGPLVDGFVLGSNFYLCSYWDTVVMSPLAYQNSTTPVFGVRLLNQGRGLINNNCWSNTDSSVYGVDARDIWVFDGSNFSSLGNQKVRDYFFRNLHPTYSERLFMVNNTQKYQIEIYYPDLNSTGWCNKMLSWRYDLNVWNAPRDVQNACSAVEAPTLVSGAFKLASRAVTYAKGSTPSSKLIQTGSGTSFNGAAIPALFERNNLAMIDEKGAPVPYSSKVYVHRILPEVSGSGVLDITIGGAQSTAQATTYGQTGKVSIDTNNPWVTTQQNAVRTVSVKIESNNATDPWNVTALNWQTTIVEDSF
jgi:hypothetical protein